MITAIKQFINIIDSQSDTTGLQSIKEIIDELNYVQGEHPKKFANYIGTLIEIAQNYILELENKVKGQLFQLVLSSMELYPSILRKNPQRVQRLFDIIYRVMGNISYEVSQNWFKPPIGYDQDNLQTLYVFDSNTAIVCEFRNFVDRIGIIIGYMKTIQIIQNKAYTYYNDGDWRYKSAILMCFSQLSEDLDMDKIDNVLKLLNMGFNNQHPKVRFAAVQALGQLSDDLKPDFQNKYFNQLMPIIINGFKDNVQRVSSHWMACMTNFIEDYSDTEEIIPYVNQIFVSVCQFIQNGMIQSKQNALATLSSLVTVPSLFDKTTIKKPFQICHSILQTFPVQNHKQLINQAIECLTISASSQPYLLVKEYFPFLVQILNQVCEKISPEYFTAGWHRLCTIGHKFQNWQPVYQKLLSCVQKMENDIIKSGFDSILCTVDCFKEDFYPFAFQTLAFLEQARQNGINDGDEQVASAALHTIQQIINKAKPTSPDSIWDNKVKTQINQYCLKVLQPLDQDMYQVSEQMLQSIKQLLKDYTYLYIEQQLLQLYNNFWGVANTLQEKKVSLINNQIQNMNINEEDQQMDEDLQKQSKQHTLNGLNQCKLIIPDIVHEIMKKITKPTPIIKDLLQHVSVAISSSLDQQDFRYATYYIDNLLDFYDYNTLKDYWENIYKYLAQFSLNSDATVRNSATYGIGVFAQKTPFQLVSVPVILQWVELVKTAYIVPKKDSQTKKIYGHCQDNCVAVVGKILKKFNKSLNLKFLYQKWLQALPLKFDHQQNRIQMRYLCQILQQQPQIIIDLSNIDEGIKRLRLIFKIFSEVIKNLKMKNNNKENQVLLKLCKETLRNVMQWPIYKQKQNDIINDLKKGQKFQIQELLTNDLLLDN